MCNSSKRCNFLVREERHTSDTLMTSCPGRISKLWIRAREGGRLLAERSPVTAFAESEPLWGDGDSLLYLRARNAPCKMAALARPSLVQAHRNRRSGAARVFRIPRIDGEKTRSLPRFFEHTRKAKDGRDNSMMDVLVAGAGIAEVAAKPPGVTLHTGARVSGPLFERGRLTGLLVEGQPIRARLVVGADGAHSRLRHALNLNRASRRKRLGICRHFGHLSGVEPRAYVEVFLGRGHELYVTPLRNGEILVAALADADAMECRVEE